MSPMKNFMLSFLVELAILMLFLDKSKPCTELKKELIFKACLPFPHPKSNTVASGSSFNFRTIFLINKSASF